MSAGGLTARQREVAVLAVSGLRNREVAARLGIAKGTVSAHMAAAYRVLGVRNRVQLRRVLGGEAE